jgi:RimJ/RimL family protein N-acetyltransferase
MQQSRMTAPPALETERLLLRGHEITDLSDCVAMWSDPQVVRYTIGQPSPPQRSWLRILSYRGHWALLGFGYWAVQEKASGRYIGEIGFADFKREMTPSLDGMPELGWALAPWAQGRGYAIEALNAAVAWGDERFQALRTVCIIHRDNERSLRIAAKLGYAVVLQAPNTVEPNAILAREVQVRQPAENNGPHRR